MKALKWALAIAAFAVFTHGHCYGQPVHNEIVVTLDELNYDNIAPGIGTVSGTYTYHFSYKLSKEGYLEAVHWNARDFNLYNDKGDKVIVTDSGHDTYGILWIWFNTPDYMNGYDPTIDYDCEEGWLDDFMPETMPSEGVSVEMGCKVLCKGKMFRMSILANFKINANGVQTVEFIRIK